MTTTKERLRLLEGARVYDLGQPMENGMPQSPNHPAFRLALTRRHGDMVRADGSSAAAEIIVTGGHVGTHIDALAHVSFQGQLHGGIDAAQAQTGGRFGQLGVDTIAPIACRGVLLDVAATKGRDVLDPGYAVTAADLDAAARRAGVRLQPGDAVLVRTGWGSLFGDRAAFVGHDAGVPGPNEEAARWLVSGGAEIVGSDTIAFEEIPPGAGHSLLPVHRFLLFERGVHIVETLNLEELGRAGVSEFLFFASPLRIVGGTGSPIRPVAIV